MPEPVPSASTPGASISTSGAAVPDIAAVYAFSRCLANAQSEREIFSTAVSGARRILSAGTAAIFTTEDKIGAIWLRCTGLDSSETYNKFVAETNMKLANAGLVEAAVREGKVVHFGLAAEAALKPRSVAGDWQESRALIVPLPTSKTDLSCPGVFVFVFPRAQPVDATVALAEAIARQTADALHTARLVERTRQQAAELKLLEQIGRSLSQRLSMADTLNELVQNVSRVVGARWATVMVYDPSTQFMRTSVTTLPQPEAKSIAIPLTAQSIVVTCLREGVPQVAPDMFNDPRCNQELNRRFNTAAGVCVPLGPPGLRFGVLMVNNPEPSAFSADDVRRLEQLAQLATAALERARIHEDMCQRADELILMNEIGRVLVENPVLENTLQRIAELVCRNFQAAGAGFLLLNDAGDALVTKGVSGEVAAALRNMTVPLALPGVTTMAFKQNQMLVVEDTATDRRVNPQLQAAVPGTRAIVVIPLVGNSGPVGVFGLWKKQPCRFLPRDIQCLHGVGRLASAAVSRDELDRALRKSEVRLQEIVDGLHAMIFSLDADGRILSFNAAAERISGVARDAVLGRRLPDVVNPRPAEIEKLENMIAGAFKTGDCSKEMVLLWATSGGGERQIRLSASFLRGADQQPTGMVCLGVDITEQALLEAQLLQAQKMESVGALAGGMAHDFNNLLGGIIGLCTLAKASAGGANPAFQNTVAKIESAAQRGANLTSKLMTFARKSILQPRPIDMAELVAETTGLLAGMLPQNITVVTRIAQGLPAIYGDATQLQQVLLNLCVNARDALPHGGTLTIGAEPLYDTAAGDPAAPPSGVLLEISDNGTGMTPEVQQHLFEPFFTTKEPGKGTGLGLSVVFGIVRSHGGKISVQSQMALGTTFSIRLPSDKKTSTSGLRAGIASESGEIRAAAAYTVLLIDDDQILRDTISQLLGGAGYNVVSASGGADAIKQLSGIPPLQPSVIVLDVVMPGLSGTKLLRELQQRVPNVPVLLMSGYSADATVKEMIGLGARELLQKPFTVEVLIAAIQRVVQTAIR